MLAFMRGHTQQFYMMFIAPDIRQWTVESVGQALFNYCFPPVFRRQMQMKFNELSQGKHSVHEYLQHSRSIAARLPDINKFQLIQKYWDGPNQYLHFKWTENGYTPEFSTLVELELAAERYENAENLQLFEICKQTREPCEGNMNNSGNRGVQLDTQKTMHKDEGRKHTFTHCYKSPFRHNIWINSDPTIRHHIWYSDIRFTIHIASMLFIHSISNPKSFQCSDH